MSACKAGRGLGGLYRGLHQGRFCSTLGDRGAVETSRPIQGWLGAGVGCILSFFFKIKNKPTLFCIPWAVALYPGAGWSEQEHGMDPGISSECTGIARTARSEQHRAPGEMPSALQWAA